MSENPRSQPGFSIDFPADSSIVGDGLRKIDIFSQLAPPVFIRPFHTATRNLKLES